MGERFGIDAQQVAGSKHRPAGLPDGAAAQSPAPVFFGQVVPQFTGAGVDVLPPGDGNAAHRPILHRNGIGVDGAWLCCQHLLDKPDGVLPGVGIGDAVPKVVLDNGVIQRNGQAVGVGQPPGAQGAGHGGSSSLCGAWGRNGPRFVCLHYTASEEGTQAGEGCFPPCENWKMCYTK